MGLTPAITFLNMIVYNTSEDATSVVVASYRVRDVAAAAEISQITAASIGVGAAVLTQRIMQPTGHETSSRLYHPSCNPPDD